MEVSHSHTPWAYDDKSAKYQSTYKGEAYYFCSADCKSQFDKNPLKYIRSR